MNIYEDIGKRTNGEIYVGVVGPVRTGKSTVIKKFMEEFVLPNIEEGYDKARALDEMPQSAQGKTVMTTEPKFIPDEAVSIKVGNASMKVRLIDCVGYLINGAIGTEENGEKRMIQTPWEKDPMEFERAAELGTKKVICDHSTVGLVVTTDGTIGDFSREDYIKSEEKVISELKALGKPFVIILNSQDPSSKLSRDLAIGLEEKYSAPVALVSALDLTYQDFEEIIKLLLGQFSVSQMIFDMPKYISTLENDHWLKQSLYTSIRESVLSVSKIDDTEKCLCELEKNEYIVKKPEPVYDLGNGNVLIKVDLLPDLYYKIMSELCGITITNDEELFLNIKRLSECKKEFDKFTDAIDQVNSEGYGIVLPDVNDMTLEEPEIVKQAGAYGVKLRASAPSIHMIKASIETEINPIVGTAEQSKEIIKYMLDEFEDDPKKIWDSNMFGKSLYELVNEGLHAKLEHISPESRSKLSDTLTRVINEGANGLICIIL
ncbi:MAG: stage IV sporulation protein A [Clostridia bacterium]|nr:stage IV sporulation protein A [Clostridia bacterium]